MGDSCCVGRNTSSSGSYASFLCGWTDLLEVETLMSLSILTFLKIQEKEFLWKIFGHFL